MVSLFPEAISLLLRFRRKYKTRGFKYLAFGDVMGLRHSFELLASNWGPVSWFEDVFPLCLVGVTIFYRCMLLLVRVWPPCGHVLNRSCRMRLPADFVGRKIRWWGSVRFVLPDFSLSLSWTKCDLIRIQREQRALHMFPSPPQGLRPFFAHHHPLLYPIILGPWYSSPRDT